MRFCSPCQMRLVRRWATLMAVVSAVLSASLQGDPPLEPAPASAAAASFENDIKPFVTKYCFECHQGEKSQGGLALERYMTEAEVLKHRDVAEKILDNLESGLMPPEGKPQPTDAERQRVIGWIEAHVLKINCDGPIDPGRVTIRRLNRSEYNNTIRDLLGVDFRPADDFPSDDVGYGFDNIGDVISLPPVLLERYLAAAEKITERAIVTPDADQAPIKSAPGKALASVGEAGSDFEFPQTGDYILRVRAWADQAGPEPAKMTCRLGDQELQTVDVEAVAAEPRNYEMKLKVEAGKRHFAAKFINDYYKPDDPDPKLKGDRNLYVDRLEVQGPIGVLPENLPASHTRLVTCRPSEPALVADCARVILRPLAGRAFRRPATDDEVSGLVRLVELVVSDGSSFERGVQVAVQGILVSPQFLFRVELDPEPHNSQAVRTLGDYELATRLSYFLWSSLPDDELFRLAEAGTLRHEGNLAAQVRRMLKDPKSSALVEDFAGQWLQLRTLRLINPDKAQFPQFDEALRAAMETETKMFFEAIVREDRNLFDFLDADFTFVNERLARHYEIPGVTGEQFQRVTLATAQRGGLLGQASILLVTSNPTRTSPVKRGKWVLENLLNAAPPPPPPGVPELSEEKDKVLSGTLRQRMEQHRANPACAACHTQMDALGFGLENYDPIGAWRVKDGTFDIDASGTLPGGAAFSSPAELRVILKSRQNEFRRCLAEKLLTFALGRGLEYYDKCTVDQIARHVAANHDKFSALVLEIVQSDPFQKRRGKSGDER
ncbi:MAG: DUF1592 domain-containing protein [Planctomycetaceae bacterium]|nr:DUF1592 domain-containing protein [Planctomycetaceae bacterium]